MTTLIYRGTAHKKSNTTVPPKPYLLSYRGNDYVSTMARPARAALADYVMIYRGVSQGGREHRAAFGSRLATA